MGIIGIDLGTTNSLGAYWRDGKAHLIPNAVGDYLTPSVVSVDEDGSILVGKAAQERLRTHPSLSVSSFKRKMGSKAETTLGNHKFTPEELSSLVIQSIKQDAEKLLDEPVTEAVISVPAYFSDAQRNATKIAGELAGIKVDHLINEPTAAAIAYGLHDRSDECQFIVLDLGGGTFDVSILELFDGVMEVHSSAGDNFLGGEDFTDILVNWYLEEAGLSKEKLDSSAINRLTAQCEKAKKDFYSSSTITIQLNDAQPFTINKDAYEAKCKGLLQRMQRPIERALRDSNIHLSELDDVILVGGATRSTMVKSLASRLFQRLPSATINPDEVVALGTAIQAGLTQNDAALSEVVLTDVCPYTLGIEIAKVNEKNHRAEGHFSPIIERNSIVPISRVDRFNTVNDGQVNIELNIYQGESRLVRNNIKLGSISVTVPKGAAGEQEVDVRFTYDRNGLLEVEVTRIFNGVQEHLVIENSENRLNERDIKKCLEKLKNLKLHPRESLENRTLLARADRLYEEVLDARDYISYEVSRFELLIEGQDLREVAKGREALSQLLDQIEQESVF